MKRYIWLLMCFLLYFCDAEGKDTLTTRLCWKRTIENDLKCSDTEYSKISSWSKKCLKANHLSNTRVVLSDRVVGGKADIVAAYDYYPFGLISQKYEKSGSEAKYLFNGKEMNKEWAETYDYGARTYDPRIGRFVSVDPIAGEYPHYSPYQFAGLNPIKFVDLDGLEPAYRDPSSSFIVPASDHLRHTPGPNVEYLKGPTGYRGEENELIKVGVSFIPGIGDVMDAKETHDDFKQGNYAMATLGLVTLIPGGDLVAKPIKLALRNTDKLKTALKIADKANDAHHLIPTKLLKENKVVQDAVEAGFDFNGITNGIELKRFTKAGEKAVDGGVHANHPDYTAQVKDYLNTWADAHKGYKPKDAKKLLESYASKLKKQIKEESVDGGKKVNDLKLGGN